MMATNIELLICDSVCQASASHLSCIIFGNLHTNSIKLVDIKSCLPSKYMSFLEYYTALQPSGQKDWLWNSRVLNPGKGKLLVSSHRN